MRVLRVRFQNLNSLAGEWDIDFSEPSFFSEGIVAITGPTGAGKSTILDAVCLALYGRTPRLHRVNKGVNEIISRRTGECFAEVCFETRSGSFRCHWSQRRARKKADGELQPPKHEFSNAVTGEILETGIQGVAERVQAATGMDFERFTRTMFLAQGSFAAFLLAAPDERAPILEQITGTGVYSDISRYVHERHALERKKLDELETGLSGLQMLTSEEEESLRTEAVKKQERDKELEQRVAVLADDIKWLQGISGLEGELEQLARQKLAWQTRMEDFAPRQEKLLRAMQALELAGSYSELESLRKAWKTGQGSLAAEKAKLPAAEAELAKAEERARNCEAALLVRQAEQTQRLPVLRKARDLDLRMREKNGPLHAAGKAVSAGEKALRELEQRQERDSAELARKKASLQSLRTVLDAARTDETLVEQLAGLRALVENLQQLAGRGKAVADEKKRTHEQREQNEALLLEQGEKFALLKEQLELQKFALGAKLEELSRVLESRPLSEWREELLSLTRANAALEQAAAVALNLQGARQPLAGLAARAEKLAEEAARLEKEIPGREKSRALLEDAQTILEKQFDHLQKVHGLIQERERLEDGRPCPLCGATEHPYARGNVPLPDESRDALRRLRKDIKAEAEALAGLRERRAAVLQELEQSRASLAEREKIRAGLEDEFRLLCAGLGLPHDGPGVMERLEAERGRNFSALQKAGSVIRAAEAAEQSVQVLRRDGEKAAEALAGAETEATALGHKADLIRLSLRQLEKEAAALQAQETEHRAALLERIQGYGIEALPAHSLADILPQLVARRDLWLSRQKEKAVLEQEIAALGIRSAQQDGQLQKDRSALALQKTQHAALQLELDTLRTERAALLADQDPDAEEERLAAAVTGARQDLDAATARFGAARESLGALRAGIAELGKSLDIQQQRLVKRETAFSPLAQQKGFADEAAYLTAALPEEERKALMEEARLLADEKTAVNSQEQAKKRQLERERGKQRATVSQEELESGLVRLKEEQRAVQRELGGIHRKLADNAHIRQKQQEQALAVDAQKKEQQRWAMLNELIGSHDGKKYRNFAQGLTFELLIAHANLQLQKLSDRYLLLHDPAQPLELSVIDNYQAGEVRTAKNLSGGESFLVSLALALGLSQMAGQNVRVDSLFLDEGFGSLDEDALETALETLSGLRQEGKLIVVISHVQALKDRIATQIKVTPLSGGRSRISGPGVVAG